MLGVGGPTAPHVEHMGFLSEQSAHAPEEGERAVDVGEATEAALGIEIFLEAHLGAQLLATRGS